MKKIEWEKEVPIVVAEFLKRYNNSTTGETLKAIRVSDVKPITSVSEIREIAKRYAKRFGIPIRISERPFDALPYADACYEYRGSGKAVIYLHPILVYYPKSYIVGAIEHELEHADVESRWEDIL